MSGIVARGILLSLLLLLPSCSSTGNEASRQGGPFTVAAIQFNPKFRELDGNLEPLARRFEEAARKGAKIIVAPEMATTGYLYTSRADIKPFVDTIPGRTTDRFSRISRRYSCYIAWGMPEVDAETGIYYNSAALVGPEGYVGRYRKTHLWEAEAHWSAWGNEGVPVFETPLGNLSLIICQDANHIETFRSALLGGADIVCFMTNSSGQTIGHLQARAIQNGLYIVSANRSLKEKDFTMKGCSAVWAPRGEKLAEAGIESQETVYAEVDPSRFGEKAAIRRSRKPSLYMGLVTHVGPWDYTATTRPRKVHAVAVQYEPVVGSKTDTLKRAASLLERNRSTFADLEGERLIVLPELSFTGPASAGDVERLAEPVGGPLTREIAALSVKYKATIVFGLIEREGRGLYNTAVAVSPEGRVLGRGRKIHLSTSDREWATPGDRFEVIEFEPLGRLGLLVGSDAYVAEAGVLLAIKRADIVAVPSGWHGEVAGRGDIAINPRINPHGDRGAMVVWDNLASTGCFWTVVANFVGTPRAFGGRSGIYALDPIYGITAERFAGTAEDEVIAASFETLGKGHWITQDHYINSRRPDDLYYRLVADPVRAPARK